MATLRMGSRGAGVAELQSALNFVGSNSAWPVQKSMLPPLEPDGIFGQKTHMRVVEFQRKSGLAADGIVGPKTLAKLADFVPGGLAASKRPAGGAAGGPGAGKLGGGGPGKLAGGGKGFPGSGGGSPKNPFGGGRGKLA